jgi:hypothetical protein
MNLKPVVTSLFLMGLACGSVLAEGLEGDNGNGDVVAQQDVDIDVDAALVDTADLDVEVDAADVRISGVANVDYARRDFRNAPYYGYSTALSQAWTNQDDYLAENRGADGHFGGNVQLNVDASMGDNAAHLGLLYLMDDDNGRTICNGTSCNADALKLNDVMGKVAPESLSVLEGYVEMANLAGTPVHLTWGHGYTDFGKSGVDGESFSHLPVLKSGTQMLTQTRGNFVKVGMSDLGMKGVHLTAYVLDHKNTNEQGDHFDKSVKQKHEDRIAAWGANGGYNFATKFLRDEQWGLNFGLVSNPGGAEIVESHTLNTAANLAMAFSGHLRMDAIEIDGSYVQYGRIYNDKEGDTVDRRTLEGDTVISDGNKTSASALFNGDNSEYSTVTKDDKPMAWDIRGAYCFADTFGPGASSQLFARYGQTSDTVRLFMPKATWQIGLNQGLGSGASVTLSYAQQSNFDKKNADGTVATVKDKNGNASEMKGSTNSVTSMRLSYAF